MTTRDVILREMGLTPIWRDRRDSAAVTTGSPPVAAPESPSIRAAASATAAAAVALVTDDANVAAVVAAGDTMPSARATPEPHEGNAPDVAITSAESAEARQARISELSWDALRSDIASCTACKLCSTRTLTVPGVGDPHPDWFVVGEAPGENEDKQGEPFVGKAGQLLDAMLAAVGKKRGAGVYIANVIKCRPPGNRNPEPDEIAACTPYLQRQVALAKPKLLLAAGKFAAQTLLESADSVATLRARGGSYAGVPVVVTYHPSYLLRTPADKAKAWEDLLKARTLVP